MKKILFVSAGQSKGEVNVLSGEELRMKLRATLKTKFPNKSDQEILEMVPADVEQMTYQHALLLAGLDTESHIRNRDTNAEVRSEDLVEQDFGPGQEVLAIDLAGAKGFKARGIQIIDMNASSGKLFVDYVTGDGLRARLAACGQPAPQNAKGMTVRDALHLLRGEQNIDLTNSPLKDYKSPDKGIINIDEVIDQKVIMASSLVLVAAKPIEGNLFVRLFKRIMRSAVPIENTTKELGIRALFLKKKTFYT